MSVGRYRSGNRERIRKWFQAHEGQAVSAMALSDALAAEGIETATATLYRNLGQLVQEGFLVQVASGDGRGDLYLHRRENDAGMLCCRNCGHVEVLECARVTALFQHLAAAHRFHIDGRNMVFSGFCNRCQEVEDAQGKEVDSASPEKG